MKFSRLAIIVLAALIGFIACQKELDFDLNAPSSGTILKDASGNCMPAPVNGIYQKDTTLTGNNYIDISVNVTVVGTYDIKSDTVNGYSFQVNGTFGTTGTKVLRLFGTGKPLAAGVNSFTIQYGTSTCVVDVTVIGPGGGVATYTLGGAPAACSGFTLGSGTYTAGQILLPANSVITNVNVTGLGTYDLGTDTLNGIYFRSTGVFTTMGVQSITLNGTGTPLAAGTFTYHLNNGSTTCTFDITVAPSGGTGAAAYTLGGSPGTCTGVTLAGTYKQGVALTTGNTVKVDVTVTTIGTYTISVAANNNVSFSASGNFTITGAQQLTLTGTGTPAAQGPFNYVINGPAGTTCTFTITYDPATVTPPSTNLDYIPQTTGSNWSTMLEGGGPGDTTYMEVSPDSKTLGGNSYKIFEIQDTGTPTDSLYFRTVNPGQYFQYFDDDFGLLDAPYTVDLPVLDSTKSAGYSWSTNLGANTAGGGTITISSAKIQGRILEKGATKTVGTTTYNNVIRVEYTYSAVVPMLGGNITIATEERWYAKGYGVIKDAITVQFPPPEPPQIINTTRTQIF